MLSVRKFTTGTPRAAALPSVSYSKTLQLPRTTFGPKIPNKTLAKPLIKTCSDQLYHWQYHEKDTHSGTFILHDGPPYANGDLHLGHSLNKIAKDIINRWQLLGHNQKVLYRPGWDCHGLPIEMKAVSNNSKLTPTEIRSKCRELAMEMIDKQRDQFRDFAIMTDFDHPYITLNHSYEVAQLHVFKRLVENGLLSRQLKPVWWGTETQTALAEAELEYKTDHISTAVYVKYKVVGKKNTHLLIWTSTPWTLPANKAICINESLSYTTVKNQETGEQLVVTRDLAESVVALNTDYIVSLSEISGSELLHWKYQDPVTLEERPILHGDHVTNSAGTGLVHTAPAHGGEDYTVGKRNGLDVESSVDNEGKYCMVPSAYDFLLDMSIEKGAWKVIGKLQETNLLYHMNKKFRHSYPYDWRLGKPVIQRATSQWFVNVEKIKAAATAALDDVKFYPQAGKNRLLAFTNNRSEWCISRQRVWGVPIPVVYDATGKPILEVMDHIIAKMDEFGTDEWFTSETDILRWLPKDYDGTKYHKGRDTMDVWFDSGTSWTTLAHDLGFDTEAGLFASEKPLADVYLEGSDQHRGWFQSSLLNKVISLGVNGRDFKPVAPFKQIITHGFTLDSKNDKMSKSKGNVILPKHAMEGGGKPLLPALGTDGLRLWVASSNYMADVNVTTEVLNRVFENHKKIRITLKYLLGNLNDGWAAEDTSYSDLSHLDRYVLSRLARLQKDCEKNYDEHAFQRVVKDTSHFIATELSALYFDILKDCLYTDAVDSPRRRGIQTVLKYILRTQLGLWAPIQPVLTQEVWQSLPEEFTQGLSDPFRHDWKSFYQLPAEFIDENLENDFKLIWDLKATINKQIEQFRTENGTKSSLELELTIGTLKDSKLNQILHEHASVLADYFIVSGVLLETSKDTVVTISRSANHKCPRCWKYTSTTENSLCGPCDDVVHR